MEIFEEEKTFWKHLEKVVNITKDLETCGYILKPLENTAKFCFFGKQSEINWKRVLGTFESVQLD